MAFLSSVLFTFIYLHKIYKAVYTDIQKHRESVLNKSVNVFKQVYFQKCYIIFSKIYYPKQL